MNINFTKIFVAQLAKINDQQLLNQISNAINTAEGASSINNIKELQGIAGFDAKYILKLGEYRIGIKLVNEHFTNIKTLIFSAIFNIEDVNKRKDIHKLFS